MTDYTIGDLVKETWHNFTDHPAVKYPLRIAAGACIAVELDAVCGMVFGDNIFAHLSGLYDKYHNSALLFDPLYNPQNYESTVRLAAGVMGGIMLFFAIGAYAYLDKPVMKKLSDLETNPGEKNDAYR